MFRRYPAADAQYNAATQIADFALVWKLLSYNPVKLRFAFSWLKFILQGRCVLPGEQASGIASQLFGAPPAAETSDKTAIPGTSRYAISRAWPKWTGDFGHKWPEIGTFHNCSFFISSMNFNWCQFNINRQPIANHYSHRDEPRISLLKKRFGSAS